MRIQTRLFLACATPLLALVVVQLWLQQRQLKATECELAAVATSVGHDVLVQTLPLLAPAASAAPAGGQPTAFTWVAGGPPGSPGAGNGTTTVDVVVTAEQGSDEGSARVRQVVRSRVTVPAGAGESGNSSPCDAPQRLELKVLPEVNGGQRFLVLRTAPGSERRVQIPTSPTVGVFRSTLRDALAWSAGLLVVGLVASGLIANRLSRPLRSLARGAEAIGRGELGAQVPLTSGGEVGELERAFNLMSSRLAELERERERWRQQEHLAQLGDLSRGLAHTLRNPLNTLGLATEELATVAGEKGQGLATTARGQIRRIDRWLRSFLALGAGEAARAEVVELGGVVQEVGLEAIQQGAQVDLAVAQQPLPVTVVPTALRAALANLLSNAVEASPEGATVEVAVTRQGNLATVTVRDHGAGLPEDVRRRLFQPHVTTKVEGSGMGLFLARELVVGLCAGELALADAEGGGTLASVTLRLAEDVHAG